MSIPLVVSQISLYNTYWNSKEEHQGWKMANILKSNFISFFSNSSKEFQTFRGLKFSTFNNLLWEPFYRKDVGGPLCGKPFIDL